MKVKNKYIARFTSYNSDLFWEFVTPTVFNRARKTENIKIIGGGEILRWSGYNDRDWWNTYSKEEGRNKRTDKLGQEWEIDYKNCEITLVSKPKGKFI